MKKFKLFIGTENAAFHDDGGEAAEICRILSRLIEQINYSKMEKGDEGILHDNNGNTVGAWEAR